MVFGEDMTQDITQVREQPNSQISVIGFCNPGYINNDEDSEQIKRESYDNDSESLNGLNCPIPNSPTPVEEQKNKIKEIRKEFLIFWKKVRGIGFTILCSLSMSLSTFCASFLVRRGFHSSVAVLWRFLGIFIPTYAYLFYLSCKGEGAYQFQYISLTKPNKREILIWLIIRGLLGSLTIIVQFYSFHYISLGDSTAIIFSNPVFVALFAHFLLNEKCDVCSGILATLTLIGVFIISKPMFIFSTEQFAIDKLKGVLLAFVCTIGNSIIFVILRHLKEIPALLISLFFGNIGVFAGLIFAVSCGEYQNPHNIVDLLAFISLAILSGTAQWMLNLSLQYEEAGNVAIIRSSDIIFSFLWQMTLGIFPDICSIIGSVIIISCVLFIGGKKWLERDAKKKELKNLCLQDQ